MGASLFKIFGIDITGKLLIRLGLGIVLAIAVYLGYRVIQNHFDHIKDLEAENKQLTIEASVAEGQRDLVLEINKKNTETNQLNRDIQSNNRNIATAERAAANARTQTYREIRDAIQNSPPSADPVDPVITDTLNRLWSGTPAEDGN